VEIDSLEWIKFDTSTPSELNNGHRTNPKTMRDFAKQLVNLASLAFSISFVNSVMAETVISTFDDFNLDGLFPSWAVATVVSSPTGYSITASGYGSGYKGINPNIDATGETNIELTVTLSGAGPANSPISGPIVSLVDADGTFYNYAWYGQTAGTHVLKANLSTPTFISAPGSVSGLDLNPNWPSSICRTIQALILANTQLRS